MNIALPSRVCNSATGWQLETSHHLDEKKKPGTTLRWVIYVTRKAPKQRKLYQKSRRKDIRFGRQRPQMCLWTFLLLLSFDCFKKTWIKLVAVELAKIVPLKQNNLCKSQYATCNMKKFTRFLKTLQYLEKILLCKAVVSLHKSLKNFTLRNYILFKKYIFTKLCLFLSQLTKP